MFCRAFIFRMFLLSAFCAAIGAEQKPIEIWANSPTDVKYYTKMVKVYQDKVDKNFKANVRHFGFLELPDKLTVAIKTGINTPDIVQIDELFFSMFLPDQIPFADITDKLKASGLDKNILPQRLSLFGYKDRIYGLPQSVSAVVLYYRNDLLNESKLSVNDFETWDKFVEAGKKVASAGGRSLIALDWSYFEILLKQRGYDFFDEKGNLALETPVAVETLEFLSMLAKEKVGVNPDRGNIFDPVFFSGDVTNNEMLCIMSSGWYGMDMLNNFSPPNAKGNWKAIALPIWTDEKSKSRRPTSTFAGQGLCIYKKSPNIEQSWKFIDYIMNDIDANVSRFVDRNCFPAFIPAWADGRMSQPDPLFGGQIFGNLMVELAPQIPETRQAPMRAQVIGLLREKYWSALMSGKTSAAQILNEITAEVKQGMKSK